MQVAFGAAGPGALRPHGNNSNQQRNPTARPVEEGEFSMQGIIALLVRIVACALLYGLRPISCTLMMSILDSPAGTYRFRRRNIKKMFRKLMLGNFLRENRLKQRKTFAVVCFGTCLLDKSKCTQR